MKKKVACLMLVLLILALTMTVSGCAQKEPEPVCEVTFVVGGEIITTTKYYSYDDEIIIPAVPDVVGYIGQWEDFSIDENSPYDIKISCNYSPISYSVTFDGNGSDSGQMDIQHYQYDESCLLYGNEFVKDGCEFLYWTTSADGSGDIYYDQADIINLTSVDGFMLTLYAQWQADVVVEDNSLTATLMANDGTSNSTSQYFDKDTSQTLPLNTFSRSGYDFVGWNTSADGSGTSFEDGAYMGDLITSVDGALTLYAQWQENIVVEDNSLTVTLVTNDGTSNSTSQYFDKDTSQTLPLNTFSRSGYDFVGWNTSADGSGTSFEDGAYMGDLITSVDGALTLYAQWQENIVVEDNSLTVTFMHNNGSGIYLTQSFTKYSDKILNVNSFVSTGYDFVGWNTSADGSGTSYADGAYMGDLITSVDGTLTLYAQWQRYNNLTVTFTANNAIGEAYSQYFDKTTTSTLTDNLFYYVGYTFVGWNTSADGSGTSYADGAYMGDLITSVDDTLTLYAQWQRYNNLTVTFTANNAIGEAYSQYFDKTTTSTLTDNLFYYVGYTFVGWNTSADGSGTSYADGAYMGDLITSVDGTLTLYAQWQEDIVVEDNNLTVTFVHNNGSGIYLTQSFTKYSDKTLNVNSFVSIGYTFVGWNTSADGSGTSYADGAYMGDLMTSVDGTLTLYAQWQENSLTVTLVANDGTGSSTSQYFDKDTCSMLSLNTFSRVGFTFMGWNTSADGSGTSYADGAYVGDLMTSVDGTLTLYAQWQENIVESNLHYELLSDGTYELILSLSTSDTVIVPDTYLGIRVTSIGYESFMGSTTLKTIILPDTITNISDLAFASCKLLKTVVLGNSVKTIGTLAFSGCVSLTAIDVPNTVESIGLSAFSQCSRLVSISLPFVGMTLDDNYHFGIIFGNLTSNTESSLVPTSLKTVIINGGNIPDKAFYNEGNIQQIIFGDSIGTIGEYAFFNCSSLESMILPDTLQEIAEYTFYGCSVLSAIELPSTLNTIGYWAFGNCSSIKSIIIPNSVSEIGSGAFGGCDSLEYLEVPFVGLDSSGNGIIGRFFGEYYIRDDENFTDYIPSTLKNIVVHGGAIGKYAFAYMYNVEIVTLMDGVTAIGEHAFDNCYATTLTIGSGVTSIGDYAFVEMRAVQAIILTDNVTSIGQYAFSQCGAKIIDIGSGVTSIAQGTFYFASYIKSLVIPDGVDSIGIAAFNGCTSLLSIYLPESITSMGDYAFSYCKSLKTVTLPSSINRIGISMFGTCESLESIVIPDNVTVIGEAAFSGCIALTSIDISDNITKIDSYAFSQCISLTSIVISKSVTYIGSYAFRYSTNLTSIEFVDSDNWVRKYNYNSSDYVEMDFTDSATNAEYLVNSTSLDNYYKVD